MTNWLFTTKTTGPFLERPGNFSGPNANFVIKTWCIIAQFLANKPVHFASLTLTDTFIVSFSKFIDTVIMNANRANIKELFGPGARFSKVPVPLPARNQIFKSKYKE